MDIPIEQILQDFAIVMIISTVMAVIFHKLKQPLVIGFIVAGIIIGPYSPPLALQKLIYSQSFCRGWNNIVTFYCGYGISYSKLRNIGKRTIIIATTEAFGTLIAGFFASQALGLSFFDSLFLSLKSVSVTSTVIVMRVLEESKNDER